jgi:hypothetical protein
MPLNLAQSGNRPDPLIDRCSRQEAPVARFSLAIAATLVASLALGGTVFAQQTSHPANLLEPQKGLAEPIPAWNIRGHAEEIPNVTAHSVLTTNAPIPAPSCLVVAKHGQRFDFVEAFGAPDAHFEKRVGGGDLKKFTASGGSVVVLQAPFTKGDLESARAACLR